MNLSLKGETFFEFLKAHTWAHLYNFLCRSLTFGNHWKCVLWTKLKDLVLRKELFFWLNQVSIVEEWITSHEFNNIINLIVP